MSAARRPGRETPARPPTTAPSRRTTAVRSVAPPNPSADRGRTRSCPWRTAMRRTADTGDARSLVMAMPATPRTKSAISSTSSVTSSTSNVVPKHPPRMTGSACLTDRSPDCVMPTRMNINAVVFCVMPPTSVPHANAVNGSPVHRATSMRIRRLASVFRFSVRSHIPTKNIPSPPTMPPSISLTGNPPRRWPPPRTQRDRQLGGPAQAAGRLSSTPESPPGRGLLVAHAPGELRSLVRLPDEPPLPPIEALRMRARPRGDQPVGLPMFR